MTLQILRSNDPKDEALKAKLSKPIPESEIAATIKELRAHPALAAAREYLHSLANESKAMLKDLPDEPARKTPRGPLRCHRQSHGLSGLTSLLKKAKAAQIKAKPSSFVGAISSPFKRLQ